MKDHPRIRGEYKAVTAYTILCEGSPPHTRGILYDKELVETFDRITPAYAGNTPTAETIFKFTWDHPRIRGEYFIFVVIK